MTSMCSESNSRTTQRMEHHGEAAGEEPDMATRDVERFAKLLIREVRDRAIDSCDTLLDPEANSLVAQRWRKEAGNRRFNQIAAMMIPDCVDETIFFLLH